MPTGRYILVDCVKQLTMLPASPGRMTSAPPPRYEHPPPYHVGWTRGHGVPEEVLIHRPQDSSVIAGRREYLMSRPDSSNHPMSYIILSCVVFWLCGFVFGAIAFILAGLCTVLTIHVKNINLQIKKQTHVFSVL